MLKTIASLSLTVIFVLAFFFFQPARPAQAARAIIAIDAGHGGYDEGIVYDSGENPMSEKNVDLGLARAIAADLRARGIKVFLVRQADRYMGIDQRAKLASARRPALFLSIHLSSTAAFQLYVSLIPGAPVPAPAPQTPAPAMPGTPMSAPVSAAPPAPGAGAIGDEQGTGLQTGPAAGVLNGLTPEQLALRRYYQYQFRQRPYLPQSRDFATVLDLSLQNAFPGKNVSYMEVPLPLLDAMECPAVLLECPGPQFMNYTDPSTVSGIADAVAGAIMTYGKN